MNTQINFEIFAITRLFSSVSKKILYLKENSNLIII